LAKLQTIEDTLQSARKTFWLDRKGKPELVPTGFKPIDNLLGGLGPGACMITGLATGVGKSSAMLYASMKSRVDVGIVSLEDTPDLVGARILSYLTGVDSLRIRTKDVTSEEQMKLRDAKGPSHVHLTYPIAGSINQVEDCIEALCEAGAKMVHIDYLQEIRGHKDDRRNEVAEALTRCHRATAKHGACLNALSQFHRLQDPTKPPQIWNLAESSDLEKKARVIVLGWLVNDPEGKYRVRFKLSKSNYGGAGLRFDMVRDSSGTLRPAKFYDSTEF
jgi:replicative DNA helicase